MHLQRRQLRGGHGPFNSETAVETGVDDQPRFDPFAEAAVDEFDAEQVPLDISHGNSPPALN